VFDEEELFDEKNRGLKSRDTVPLSNNMSIRIEEEGPGI
jgi:hypothetical protein